MKADTNAGVGAVWKSSAMSSDNTAYFTLTANNTASQITLNADGFTVSSINVNAVGVRWIWIAFGGSDNSEFRYVFVSVVTQEMVAYPNPSPLVGFSA